MKTILFAMLLLLSGAAFAYNAAEVPEDCGNVAIVAGVAAKMMNDGFHYPDWIHLNELNIQKHPEKAAFRGQDATIGQLVFAQDPRTPPEVIRDEMNNYCLAHPERFFQ